MVRSDVIRAKQRQLIQVSDTSQIRVQSIIVISKRRLVWTLLTHADFTQRLRRVFICERRRRQESKLVHFINAIHRSPGARGTQIDTKQPHKDAKWPKRRRRMTTRRHKTTTNNSHVSFSSLGGVTGLLSHNLSTLVVFYSISLHFLCFQFHPNCPRPDDLCVLSADI